MLPPSASCRVRRPSRRHVVGGTIGVIDNESSNGTSSCALCHGQSHCFAIRDATSSTAEEAPGVPSLTRGSMESINDSLVLITRRGSRARNWTDLNTRIQHPAETLARKATFDSLHYSLWLPCNASDYPWRRPMGTIEALVSGHCGGSPSFHDCRLISRCF